MVDRSPGDDSECYGREVGMPSDAALMMRVVGGDGEAMAEIHRRHAVPIAKSIRPLLFDWTLIEDVVQEVFTRLWRHPERFDPDRGSLRGYLKMTANGRSLDVLRNEQARRAREARVGFQRVAPPAEAVAIADSGAGDVYEAVIRLAPTERDAILLAFFGDRTYRQVAVELGLPEGTVKSQIRTGLRHLREALAASVASNLTRCDD